MRICLQMAECFKKLLLEQERARHLSMSKYILCENLKNHNLDMLQLSINKQEHK